MVDINASSAENSRPDNPFNNYEAEKARESEPEEPLYKTASRYGTNLLNLMAQKRARKTEKVLILHGVRYLVLI